MALSIEIAPEILRNLIQSRGMIQRGAQRIQLVEAMEAVETIGRFCTPNFVLDTDNRQAYIQAVKWVINDPTMTCTDTATRQSVPADPQKGLYIYGDVGTGKSLLLDIMRTFARLYKIGIKAGADALPIAWETYRADDICDLVAMDGELKPWKDKISLCIQDLGNEPGEVLYMGNRRRVLRSVLEARGDMYDRLTLISSNLRPDKLGEVYGNRVQSRIRQMCNPILLSGKDRR